MNTRFSQLLTALVSLLIVTSAHAQLLEIKGTNSNWLFARFTAAGGNATAAGPPTGSNQASEPVTANSTFRGMGQIGGSSAAKLGTFGAYTPTPSYTFSPTDYPSNARYSGSTVVTAATVALGRSTIGGAFASGAPRFSMGEVITEPLAKADNVTTAPEGYWRSKPVEPGEVFSDQSYTVNVTNSSTSSSTVTVASVPTGVEVGSVLLGQRIMGIAGTTITLAGNASSTYSTATAVTVNSKMPLPAYTVSVKESSNSGADANKVTVVATTAANLSVGSTLLGQPIIAISSDSTLVTLGGDANQTISSSTGTSVPVTPPLSYYYSPHADAVYASQPGRVSIIWVSLVQESGSYKFKEETFSVATSTSKPVRKIFWTEGSFDGPTVSITDGRVSTINPIYNANVPKAVVNEVSVPGYTPLVPNLKTLYFQRFGGTGEIRAYNVEGRMLIEYLGQVRAGNNVYTSLGVDVVDLVRSPTTYLTTTLLGQPILPHDAVDGSTALTAIPKSVPVEAGGGAYYSTAMQSNGVFKYVAERETGDPNRPENGSPLSVDAYNKVAFYWAESGDFGAKWPKFQDSCWLRWSPNLSDYVINTVDAAGSTTDNGLQFTDGLMPAIVYQDDPAQAAAQIDSLSQRLRVTLKNSGDVNRSLLKFTAGTENWYMNLYTQAESRSTVLASSASTSNNVTTVTVGNTRELVAGMTVSNANGIFLGTILSITDSTHYVLSQTAANFSSQNLTYTVEDGGGAKIFNSAATVGTRIDRPTKDYEIGGYISGGTGYSPSAYINPMVSGVVEANKGAIIPVNAVPGNDVLTVRWFKRIAAPSAAFKDQYIPGKIGTYKVSYPANPSQIVIAQGIGSGDLLGAEASGTIYVQNDKSKPGYNPNEEHALIRAGRAYALREDLNIYSNGSNTQPASGYSSANYTSEPYVLVAYTDASDQRPQMRAYQVVRSNGTYAFRYTATAGTLLSKPYPLPLLPLAMTGAGATLKAKDVEMHGADAPVNAEVSIKDDSAYKGFTFQDRKGFTWVHRGPHGDPLVRTVSASASTTVTANTTGLVAGMSVTGDGITGTATIVSITDGTKFVLSKSATAVSKSWTFKPALSAKLYYTLQAGFFMPGYDFAAQPPEGTVLPFLRNADRSGIKLDLSQIDANPTGGDEIDAPLQMIYEPAWPTSAPELRVGETLALPSRGLPQVRGQQSAQVLYQQSIAKDATNTLDKNSVVLFDPTCQKTVEISTCGMTKLPSSIATSLYKAKTYFQKLPPDLQQRIYFDPLLSSTPNGSGSLVFTGVFHQETTGDSYFDLNALSASQEVALLALVPEADGDRANWVKAVKGLKKRVETYYENPNKLGTYIPNSSKFVDVYASTANSPVIAAVKDPDTRVDSYAVTATGRGTGYVTMVFNNGKAFTDVGNPVSVQVFKIANQLYPGELKVINSSNPLDEQVTLRHTADFAGRPDDYEYDWRYTDGAPTAPAIYSSVMTPRIGVGATPTNVLWTSVSDPGAMLPTAQQYSQLGKIEELASGARTVSPNPRVYLNSGISNFTLIATKYEGATVSVADTSQLMAGMSVTGGAIPGTATIVSITDRTRFVLSQSLIDATDMALTFTAASNVLDTFVVTPNTVNGTTVTLGSSSRIENGMRVTWPSCDGTATVVSGAGTLELVLTQAPPARTALTFQATSLTDDEIAAGYPGLVLKSNIGADFSTGVPRKIVFSATLGDLDGCVLYVNGKAALAHNAPSPAFTSVSATTGLTPQGLSKQFNIAPGYFTKGVNSIEVAVYTVADPNASSAINFRLDASQETDLVNSIGSAWQKPGDFDATKLPDGADRTLSNTAIIGGASTNPFGGPTFVLNDRWFTMRYRPKASTSNVMGNQWSNWTAPQFTEGWVKRVLAAINPFSQRVKDLYNNAVNTDVSMLTQAGTRWEGDLALNMDNINDSGLIAIYETVLNRAKSMSIDANTNDKDTNNALLLAAGYLNDLYTILGNEASADAADPTVALDSGAVASSRFSFEAQVASSLDEEMALLRGRDDSVSPGVMTKPFYNRLVWNYTRGINSGEAIYASNYNIKEKVGSSTANGVIDAADAQRMFPQGHGDAYGHYLTALKGYYRLLWNSNFTWTPSAEAVTVLGVPVTVDFQDERKFAAAAAHLASTAEQICALTYRQNYKDDPKVGWSQFQDKVTDRGWALDEQVSRSTQGALFNWTVANALLPDVDTVHTGVQKIDRTTVLELALLPTAASSFQSTLDNANARLNPLGLSPGAIPFDIDPNFATSDPGRVSGGSPFSQMYARSLRALNNAAGAFNQAASMSRALREQTNTLDDYAAGIAQQEFAFNNQLCDIYGTPYTGDTTYSSAYTGPDLTNYFIVDRPNDLVDTSQKVEVTIRQGANLDEVDNALLKAAKLATTTIATKLVPGFLGKLAGATTKVTWNEIYGAAIYTNKTVTINPSSLVQYNDVWKSGGMGARKQIGELQTALLESEMSLLAIKSANTQLKLKTSELRRKMSQYDMMTLWNGYLSTYIVWSSNAEITQAQIIALLDESEQQSESTSTLTQDISKVFSESLPKVIGVATDALSSARAAIQAGGVAKSLLEKVKGAVTASIKHKAENMVVNMENGTDFMSGDIVRKHEEGALQYEVSSLYNEVVNQQAEMMQRTLEYQKSLENITNVIAKGNSLLLERELFRQRAAAIIQGYRTNDMTFRTFRNEALEQYRSLFDLASRYTYMAAKSYDYETGLLGTPQGKTVFSKIVASRSLGDLTGGTPQSTTSTLGDAGLAGSMAQLDADFSVAESRLGINNPDYYGTVFSLRGELFRLLDDPGQESDDDAWRQTLEQHIVSNVLNDSDVATQCLNIKKSNGSAVPGIIIPFSSCIEGSKNFFGKELAAYDHAYSVSSFATVISNAGIVFSGYVGMDAAVSDTVVTAANKPFALSATPYAYLIPCGNDVMRAPPLGDTDTIRTWTVQDQALPLPYNLGANDFNSTQFFNATGTLSAQPWIIRKHQAFRAVAKTQMFESGPPLEFSTARLIGRSAWNTRWKIVIPACTLSANEQDALNRFVSSVTDIKLYLRTYSHSGN
ncbi:MAG: hypothetical protein ORN51_12595 [Akkermansiaceae bacterium]|nr:hypothetical protein [Akkermansiaceae bacterium]